MSSGLRTSAWMGWVERSASRPSAAALPWSKSSQMRHSGFHAATTLYAIQVANDSFNQRSSHHCMVTQLPNHWWASSWVTTSAIRFFTGSDAVAGSRRSAVSR